MTAVILDEETIEWRSVADQLPDADTTVMVFAPACYEPIWLGWYYEEDGWHSVEAVPYPKDAVVAWAHLPQGPQR